MDTDSQAYKDAWARVRAAIKAELVDESMDYPEGWHGGWLNPDDDASADHMLDDLACMATRAVFGISEKA